MLCCVLVLICGYVVLCLCVDVYMCCVVLQVVDVMRHYERDVAARTRLTGCLRDAVIADPGQQIIG